MVFQTLSGSVYGLDGLPVVSGDVYAVQDDGGAGILAGHQFTSLSGTYSINLTYTGAGINYVIVASNLPAAGARAFPVISTSGGILFP